mgnify:CR=1 FL=1|jgi:hypothetical protein|tara:strand:+ start:43 stop:243 length:201 start_codon:yes stop_codon:yes gene_type:complete
MNKLLMSKRNKLKNRNINPKELGEVLKLIDKARKKLLINPNSTLAVGLDLISAANKLNMFIKTSNK